MKYVGNFSDYVPEGICEKLMRPEKISKPFIEKSNFTYKINDDSFSIDISIPKELGTVVEIWFTRLDPGDLIPLHQDTFDYDDNNLVRYSMFLQDYIPGHIFIHGGEAIFGYKRGDVYEFSDPYIWHCAGNIGLKSRLTMQFSSYRNK